MSQPNSPKRNWMFVITGLVITLLIAVFLSPFASPDPDGLDRVAQDLQFEDKALENAPAQQLPFHDFFDEYSLRNVPESIATPLAGLAGTLITFALAWGIGKLLIRRSSHSHLPDKSSSSES